MIFCELYAQVCDVWKGSRVVSRPECNAGRACNVTRVRLRADVEIHKLWVAVTAMVIGRLLEPCVRGHVHANEVAGAHAASAKLSALGHHSGTHE